MYHVYDETCKILADNTHDFCSSIRTRGVAKLFYKKLAIVIGSFISLASCKDNPVPQYGNTMTQSHKSARTLDSKINVLEVRKSIQEFYAVNGRYPVDLNELSGFNGITLKGDNFEYDPATGTLVEKE
jgi:hypothetical protein